MIIELLQNKTAKEKAAIKGQEIAKLISVPKTQVGDYWIEIQELKARSDGVELYARAWDVNGQIGFSKDGTVDLEKFIFINPPILVDDPQGEIIREWTDDITGKLRQRRLREAPKEALLQSLSHTISVKQQKFDNSKIISGKKGNTTLTAFPAAGANSPMDGRVREAVGAGNGVSWATLIAKAAADGVSANADATADPLTIIHIQPDSTTDTWRTLSRGFFLFDTSSIGDTDTIDSAILSLFGDSKADPSSITPSIDIYTSSPASNNNLVLEDYDQVQSVSQTGSPITFANFSTVAYNDFTFNATGLGNISKTGISKFGTKNANYDAAAVAPTWVSGSGDNTVDVKSADAAGTANDPKLVVEHTASSAIKTINGLAKASAKTVNGLAIASVKSINGLE